MPYPNYTRRERFDFFMSWLSHITPMIIELLLGWGMITIAITRAGFGWTPWWLASPFAIAGWTWTNYTFWCYQAWRASGPRGRIVNPFGPRGTDMQTAILWLSLGVFFHLYHVWLRSGVRRKLRVTKA